MRLLKPVLSLSVLFSFSYAMNCSLVKNVKKWGDHYYTVTTKRVTWQQAMEFAKENGGYLAIPNSAAENSFLQSLIPKPKYAWIGIYDPNYMTNYCYDYTHCAFDDSRFETIKGNPLTYKNWATNQPDNLVKSYDIVNGKQMVSPLGEHWVAMSSLNGKWADFGNHADKYNNPVKFFALIEFDKMPDCYTPDSNVTDEYQGAKCNTQIYDTKTGNLQEGQTYTCLQDKNGNYYCPAALAPCGEEWDYKDGYSVKKQRTVAYDCSYWSRESRYIGASLKQRWLTISWTSICTTGSVSTAQSYAERINKTKCKYTGYSWSPCYGSDGRTYPHGYEFDCGRTDVYYACPSGYSLTYARGRPECVTYYSVYHRRTCYRTETYYEYLCSGKNYYGNAYSPIVHQGNSSIPPHNNCKAKSYVCKPAPDRKCVWVDNKWQCSPFPCFGEGAGDYNVTNADTPVGINDANNNGWNSDGSCSGTLYIFNGKDMRCRSDDAFFGLTGGGCCDKDKVLFGLISCKEEEKILAKKNNEGMCHYVGKYCSKKLKFLGGSVCIQHKKTYCCFNSKLARIINEQGRPQLGKNWGDAKHPNCRGFTPEEFQKLDFSKMDLSEFYKQISQNISQNVLNNMTQYIQNSLQNQLNNVSP